MMKLLLAVWIMSCSSALMPPTNLTVQSQNFNHTLHWLPAADTPPGTEYCIYLGSDSNQSDTLLNITKATSLSVSVFMKDIFETYTLSVWARTNNHSSLPATTTFEPFTTVLGPPLVRVEGCGDCLLVNRTLLHGDGITPEHFRDYCRVVKFDIQWRKAKEDTVIHLPSRRQQTKINNLAPGERYCVKVVLKFTISIPNTLASDWQCAWTSPASPPAGLYLLGWSVGTVCVGVLLMMLSSGLYYSGAICRPKLKLPQNLVRNCPLLFSILSSSVFMSVCVCREPWRQQSLLLQQRSPADPHTHHQGEPQQRSPADSHTHHQGEPQQHSHSPAGPHAHHQRELHLVLLEAAALTG
ncbi:interferon alpha/beta receptor 2-like [Sardina pilchardus]|uniref:interferon alpha/beta receptor 2-like n=1 Tax=Sardina pilchardus TaxID=27697 RepID=UPI002E143CD9